MNISNVKNVAKILNLKMYWIIRNTVNRISRTRTKNNHSNFDEEHVLKKYEDVKIKKQSNKTVGIE